MIITIPIDKNDDEAKVCMSFGRAPYFLIYNTENQITHYISNTAASQQGGAGIKAAQILVDQEAEVLLTKRCGENAAEVLKDAGVMIYKTDIIPAQEALQQYLLHQLSLLDDIHPGFHGQEGS